VSFASNKSTQAEKKLKVGTTMDADSGTFGGLHFIGAIRVIRGFLAGVIGRG
jgi:hypothetical protein